METQLPRKVLHVMNSAFGGSAFSALGLIRQLREDYGIESCAVCHHGGRPEDFERLREAVRGELVVRPLYWWNKKIRAPRWRRPLIELKLQWLTGFRRASVRDTVDAARRFGADLLHSNTILTLEGGLAARQLGLPHVWHVRELIGPGEPYRFDVEGTAWGEYVASLASVVVANSDRNARCIRAWLPEDRLAVVYNGIDLARFEPRTEYDPAAPLVVGMIGSLTSLWKRHDWFVEAAAKVDPALPLVFRLYGVLPNGQSSAETHAYVDRMRRFIAERGLEERIRFTGFTDYDPAPEIDIMMHTSPKESFGRILVEAMATAAPLVGVADGGVGELIVHGETGLLAAPGDTDALARHVETLARAPALRARFGQAGLQRAREHYSLEACARGIAEVYRTAMRRPLLSSQSI